MPRVPLKTKADVPGNMFAFWDRLEQAGAVRQIHATQANNPAVLLGSRTFSNVLWTKGGLDPARREMVILKTALTAGSGYEWHQHVPIGLAAGLSREQVLALGEGAASQLFAPEEQAMLAYVEAVAGSGGVPQSLFDSLRRHLDDATIVGLTMLSAFYLGISRYMVAMALEPETTFVGWRLEGLPA